MTRRPEEQGWDWPSRKASSKLMAAGSGRRAGRGAGPSLPQAFPSSETIGGSGMVGPGPRVLVVDNDPAVRRFLRVAVKAAGFSVFDAGSAGVVSTAVASISPGVTIL